MEGGRAEQGEPGSGKRTSAAEDGRGGGGERRLGHSAGGCGGGVTPPKFIPNFSGVF